MAMTNPLQLHAPAPPMPPIEHASDFMDISPISERIQETANTGLYPPRPSCPVCAERIDREVKFVSGEKEHTDEIVEEIASTQGLINPLPLQAMIPEVLALIFELETSSLPPLCLTHRDFKKCITQTPQLNNALPTGRMIWQGLHSLYSLADKMDNPVQKSNAHLQIIKVQVLLDIEKAVANLQLCTEPKDHDEALCEIACALGKKDANRAQEFARQISDIKFRIHALCKIGQGNPELADTICKEVEEIITLNRASIPFVDEVACSLSLINVDKAIQIAYTQKNLAMESIIFMNIAKVHAKNPIIVDQCCSLARQAIFAMKDATIHDRLYPQLVEMQALSNFVQAKNDADTIEDELKRASALCIIAKSFPEHAENLTEKVEAIIDTANDYTLDENNPIEERRKQLIKLQEAQFHWIQVTALTDVQQALNEVAAIEDESLEDQAYSAIALHQASNNLDAALKTLAYIEDTTTTVDALCRMISTYGIASNAIVLDFLKQQFLNIRKSNSPDQFSLMSHLIQALITN